MLIFMLSTLFLSVLHIPFAVAIAHFNGTYEPNITDERGIRERVLRRLRREPAIWGEPAPDYSGVQLDGYVRFLNALLFVDSKIYFYQINVRIIVVDILQTFRSDLSLYSFEEYRNRRVAKLPTHDFAALISYRYAGGLAFVGGMCTSKAVMLCGFYPHNPPAMGGIFFHEVAHLIGVPHHNATDLIDVPNCYCTRTQSAAFSGCLKVPGYDHDCTLQQMVNMLEKNRCLRHIKSTSSFFAPYTDEKSLALCGNGVIEGKEECDCGLHKLCYNWNCRADECQQIIKTWQLYVCCWTAVVLIAAAIIYYICRRCWPCCVPVTYSCGTYNWIGFCPSYILQLFSSFKSVICPKNRHFWQRTSSNYTQTLRRAGNGTIGMPHKLDANGITVLIAPSDKECLVRKSTITRPTQPPPPPPPFSSRGPLHRTVAQIHAISCMSPLKRPPPLPVKPPNLSLKMITTIACDDTYELPNTTRKRLSLVSSSIVRSSTVDYSQSSEHYTDHYDSISRKFDDDFDDFDDCEMMIESHSEEQQQQPMHYAPIIPSKDRPPAENNIGNGLKSVPPHHLEHIVKLAVREESFSSSESRSQLCPSDDTVSTGLSEEEERCASVNDIVRKFNSRRS